MSNNRHSIGFAMLARFLADPNAPIADNTPRAVVYGSYLFRSETMARWAVFFDTAGIRYVHVPRMTFDGHACVDFWWVPRFCGRGAWFVVKDTEPASAERGLYAALAEQSKVPVFIAVGAPKPQSDQIISCGLDTLADLSLDRFRWHLADDHKDDGYFWLVSAACPGIPLGWAHDVKAAVVRDHNGDPRVHARTLEAYAHSARFEFCERPATARTTANDGNSTILQKRRRQR
jgi:hypothetical protein